MIQRHSIIFWRKAEKEDKSFEDISKEVYEVLNIFQSFPQELRPNYLTAKTKKDIKEFEWNYNNFSEHLEKGINKEGEVVYKDLGYSISFFSSMDGQNSCAFSITAGNKCKKAYNTLIVDLPLSFNLYDKQTAGNICDLFEKLVCTYKPFWGCISNKALSRKYGKFLEGSLPTTVHWMNYWSEEITRTVGMERIQRLVGTNSIFSFKNGILSIKETALDVENEDDISFHEKLHKQLFE